VGWQVKEFRDVGLLIFQFIFQHHLDIIQVDSPPLPVAVESLLHGIRSLDGHYKLFEKS